ncbi:hypothetical protein L484_016003 [Morus notabilis]|uniref:Uncharacterized protein n=1 Tax=Morus notabilis TaxID=981085 RepID=W9R7E0_9ROSA|nr:hypothetical protein L484_016003 [Morus notabilis]
MNAMLDALLGRDFGGSSSSGRWNNKVDLKGEALKEAGRSRFTRDNVGNHQNWKAVQEVHHRTFPPWIQGREFQRSIPTTKNEVTDLIKSWKTAVVVYRKNVESEWEVIEELLRSKLERSTELVPLATDRAVTWCRDELE